MEPIPPGNHALIAIRRLFASILAALRRMLRSTFQVLFQDQLRDLDRQTVRLGSASVESAAYVSVELQALERRLSRLETEIAGLREALTSEDPPR